MLHNQTEARQPAEPTRIATAANFPITIAPSSGPVSVTPTRIAFAITELDVGGAERAMVELVQGLSRAEWEPHVYCLGPWGPLATTLQDAGIPVTALEAMYLWDAPRILWQLRREFRQFQPAIVQTFLFHANLLGRLAAAWAGVPCIVSGIRVAERRGRWHGWLDRWTNRLVTMNVCVSRGVANFCERQGGLDPRKLLVIPNGVAIDRLQQETAIDLAEHGLDPTGPICLTIGRLEHQKGIDVLIKGLPAVIAAVPHLQVVIIGDGPDRDSLETLGQSLGVADRVHWVGRRGDVPRWLKGATLLAVPSRWEGMPNVVLEAMAAGLPVIATQVEGIDELITDGVTGIAVPTESPTAFSEAITRLIRQPELRAHLAESAQQLIREEFTTAAMVDRYVALYRRLLATPR
jgi:glycosyltransferase involved in cell wall biosynthesis